MKSLQLIYPAGRPGSSRTIAWLLALAVIHAVGCASQPAVSDTPPQPEKATITDFWTVETSETVAVLLQSDRPLTYTENRQEDLRGVSFRFPATRLDGLAAAYFPPPNPVIRSIRSTQATASGEAQVFLELLVEASYEVMPDNEGLKIVFRKPLSATAAEKMPALSGADTSKAESVPAAATAPATATVLRGVRKETRADVDASKAAPAPAAATASAAATVLREVRTEARADGVVIRVISDGPVKTANVFTLEDPARIVFDFMGLRSTFKGEQRMPVRSEWVSQVRHHGHPDKVRLVVDTDARYLKSYFMEPTADGLQITVGGRKP